MKPAERRSEQAERPRRGKPAYQLEVGTKTVLAGLLALAVVCGMFFAFGYTIGKHAIPANFTLGSAPPVKTSTASQPNGVEAPNPAQLGAAESDQTPNTLSPPPVAAASQTTPAGAPPAALPGTAPAPANPAAGGGAVAASNPPAASAGAPPPPAATANPAPQPPTATPGIQPTDEKQLAAGGVYLVQVFAGMLDDAQSLARALQNRGYPANVVTPVPNQADQLYRVEVGPYMTRPEAEAMRSRLTADGYQAVIKTNNN